MISDFIEGQGLVLEVSESETRRFGFRVTRIAVPIGEAISDEQIVTAVLTSGSQLVILRADERRDRLENLLRASAASECLLADTLVYYRWDPAHEGPATSRRSRLKIDIEDSVEDVIPTLIESFKNYQNHYSANPLLAQSVTITAYEEWATNLMKQPSSRLFVARDDERRNVLGFVLLQIDDRSRICEVVLNAVHPSARRMGVYSSLLTTARRYVTELQSIDWLYISTQSGNAAVVAAWRKLGLQPFLRLNTFHVMQQTASLRHH